MASGVEAHAAGCDSCRLELHRLSAVLGEVRQLSARTAPGSPLAGILEGVRRRIGAWEESRRDPEKSDSAVRSRVVEQIEPFLGSVAAVKVIQPADRGRLLKDVEEVLGEFLGRGAAASIVNKAVDAAIVKP